MTQQADNDRSVADNR